MLRNLLLRVCPDARGDDGKLPRGHKPPEAWTELADVVERWFGVRLLEPQYNARRDVHIKVEYHQPGGKDYDVIADGSGFHQVITLLAFLYGYQPTTILLDEPDAHLHVNLQREILDFFKRKAQERGIQFLIATHAEEFARGVDAGQIVSLLRREPVRVESTADIVRARADVSNEEIVRLQASPHILYVEGESDERILRAWCGQAGGDAVLERLVFKTMGGGNKKDMKEGADHHFSALSQIVPDASRLMLFDYDSNEDAFHPKPDNATLVEWRRRNIENYLLVPDAWKRAALVALGLSADDLTAEPVLHTIDQFFASENLNLPPGASWRDVSANIFQVVDGKRILFEDDGSLFHRLRTGSPAVRLPREQVAMAMEDGELHEDGWRLLERLRGWVSG
ncbi:MAG: ATP-dependent nuclease [Anaerolineae bacterium]